MISALKKLFFLLGLLILFFLILTWFATCKSIDGRPEEIILQPTELSQTTLRKIDSVEVIPTDVYKGGWLKKMMQGTTYRDAWATPVTAPILWLDTLNGGLIPDDKGGGDQTLSLDLIDSTGMVYTIRSINKDPSGLVAPMVKKMGLSNIIMDGISAQHPLGALLIPPLADAVNVYHTHPELYFIPHQKALRQFDEEFGNRLFYLEYEPEGKQFWLPIEGVKEIVDTDDIQNILKENEQAVIDMPMLLRARMLDIVVGDWDRHAKQWGWVVIEKEENMILRPIATDRDNVFYGIGGVIPWIINRPFFVKRLRPFKKKVDHMPGLVQPFDAYFLYNVPEEQFISAANTVQLALTDELITAAVHRLNTAMFELDGKDIIKKMKARRDNLPKIAIKFYKAIQNRGPQTEPLKGSPGYEKKFGNPDR